MGPPTVPLSSHEMLEKAFHQLVTVPSAVRDRAGQVSSHQCWPHGQVALGRFEPPHLRMAKSDLGRGSPVSLSWGQNSHSDSPSCKHVPAAGCL